MSLSRRIRLAGHQVHQAAGRGDHDLAALGEEPLLIIDGGAAHDAHGEGAAAVGQLAEFLADLVDELAGRRQDQGLGAAVALVDPVEDRQEEGGGLPGARGGIAQEAVTRPPRSRACRIIPSWIRAGRGVAHPLDAPAEGGLREAEVGEPDTRRLDLGPVLFVHRLHVSRPLQSQLLVDPDPRRFALHRGSRTTGRQAADPRSDAADSPVQSAYKCSLGLEAAGVVDGPRPKRRRVSARKPTGEAIRGGLLGNGWRRGHITRGESSPSFYPPIRPLAKTPVSDIRRTRNRVRSGREMGPVRPAIEVGRTSCYYVHQSPKVQTGRTDGEADFLARISVDIGILG